MGGRKLFSIFGVPIHVDPSFLIILGILGLQLGRPYQRNIPIWVACAGVAILVHELGHAAAFAIYGRRPQIQLYGMGGLTSVDGSELTPLRSLVVAVAGPLAGFGLGGLDLLLHHPTSDLGHDVQRVILLATFGFGVFNLLPILPLDGGQTMRSVLRALVDDRAERWSRTASVGFAAVLVLGGLWLGQWYVSILGFLFGGQNLADLRRLKDEPTRDRLRTGYEALAAGRFDEAAQVAAEVVALEPGPGLRQRAVELRAWCHLAVNDTAGARQALTLRGERPGSSGVPGAQVEPPELLLEACLAAAEGAGDEALAVIGDALAAGEWAPPKVLADLLVAPGALPVIVARIATAGPDGGPSLEGLDRLQALTHLGGAWEASATIGARRFELRPDAIVAVNIACSSVRAGQLDEAIAWLRQALRSGLEDLSVLDTDPDLARLRTNPAFLALRTGAAPGNEGDR